MALGGETFDISGNEGPAQITAVAITAPPRAPAPFSDATRLHYAYSNLTQQMMLAWNASPT